MTHGTGKTTAALLLAAAVLTTPPSPSSAPSSTTPTSSRSPPTTSSPSFRAPGRGHVWFAVMALSAALFAPIAIGVGRLSDHRAMRWAVPVGIAAAVVQVIGLSRWPLLVPGFAADAASTDPATAAPARDSFETAHRVLGNVIGETGLPAHRRVDPARARRPCTASPVGGSSRSAPSPRSSSWPGVLSPLDLPVVDTANFAGYVLWSIWLVVFGVLLRRPRRVCTRAGGPSPRPG